MSCATGWLLAVVGTVVYLLTLEPTTSFWDCGEFIAVSYLLQVGHPPGAPLYQLLAHAFTWLAGGNTAAVAACCNALSAVAGGLTVMFLYWTLLLLASREAEAPSRFARRAALVGALCYLFCDTAWFSAVESEVYSLAMLLASATFWAMLRWRRAADARWLLLVALLLGLGVCVHLLTLLTLPALLVVMGFSGLRGLRRQPAAFFLLVPLFFLIGLTPYLIIPIRSAAGTPINQMGPSFKSYIARDRYEKAPLYPRMWRHRANDSLYAAPWACGDTGLVGNLRYYASYQLSYMYLRYFMWNFVGRYNDRQGFGSPQNGQFITGLPPLDRQLVGTAARPPDSLPTRGRQVYYFLPLLLGLVGLVATVRKRPFWPVLLLFFMGGVVLSLYLNHPCYEPRERDYAYILSFYAFCIWIGFGAGTVGAWLDRLLRPLPPRPLRVVVLLLLLSVPTLMACQNWPGHDRSRRYIARDAAANILASCDRHPDGTLLFTYGDNDTFPLWYLQAVEGVRTDVAVYNIGLTGWSRFLQLVDEGIAAGRPVYFTHYAYNQYSRLFPQRLQLEGNAYRLTAEPCDSVAVGPFFVHLVNDMGWHPLDGVNIDETCCKFLEQYWRDVVLLADNLADRGYCRQALAALDKTLVEVPLTALQAPLLMEHIAVAYDHAGGLESAEYVRTHLRTLLREQLDYYHTLSPARQRTMPYTLRPREELLERL